MDNPASPAPPPAAPGQTIVIDRRERAGCLRRLLWPVLILSVLMNLALINQSGVVPRRLEERYLAGDPLTAAKIAVVELDGVIFDPTVEHVLRQIRQAREDKQVKAVVLRVDSPGGTVSGSDRIWRELATLKAAKKPVVASMGGMAASGGYYVSAPADAIFAEPTTLTGSIGVIMELPRIHGLMEKLGVEMDTVAAGRWKDMGSMFRPMTDVERRRWQAMIDETYARFVRVVAQGRKLTRADAEAVADGKVYTAEEAVKNRLVDQLGYLDDAIRDAQGRAKLDTVRVVRYAKPLGLSDLLMNLSAPRPQGVTIDAEALLRLQTPQMLLLAR
ncbi:MAG TPA: signal peptide peptidase SppA [Isosphaeraceae bacterium]|jgi:protease-4